MWETVWQVLHRLSVETAVLLQMCPKLERETGTDICVLICITTLFLVATVPVNKMDTQNVISTYDGILFNSKQDEVLIPALIFMNIYGRTGDMARVVA